jgi:flagellar motility protein MotE (MotC chaperone)
MNRWIHKPRLLPATIAMLAAVLAAKSTSLVRAVVTLGQPAAFVTAAWASAPEAPATAEKPGAKHAEHGQPAKPEPGVEKKPVADQPRASGAATVPEGPPPVTDSERAVLLELRERRQELEAREATLAARESMLAATEKKLMARIEELQSLQKKLESLDASHRQQEDVAWQGLVKVYETMKPRDAAAIFNELGMQVLLSVVDRMKEAKAAAILAAMAPDKARDVTMQLALSRTKGVGELTTGDKPSLPPLSGKAPGSGT